ncbi:MAG: putative toxin-antitoxin system toxin component, PIN family [bacterium]
MNVVVDTNVLASGLISTGAPPARIVDLVRAGSVVLVVDDRILEEYEDVLHRDLLRRFVNAADAVSLLDFLRHESVRVVCDVVISGLPDPWDVPFLEAALTSGVSMITGNQRHYPIEKRRGCKVFSPREFLDVWEC